MAFRRSRVRSPSAPPNSFRALSSRSFASSAGDRWAGVGFPGERRIGNVGDGGSRNALAARTSHRLAREEDFEALRRSPFSIVFKHSTECSVSARAHRELERFLEAHPQSRIHKVEVIESRRLSDYIQAATGVRHESPQVLVFRDGVVVWQYSHFRVTAAALASAVAGR